MNEIEVEEETAAERQEREDFESYLAALETFLVARPGITFTDAAEAFVLAHETEPWMVRRMIEAVMSRVAGD